MNGFSAYLSAQSTNSNSFSEHYVGDLQGVSNIDAGAAVRLYELWLEQNWQQLSLRAGLYDLNSEFDTNDTGAALLNSAFGIGSDFAQSGSNGPSIFPTPGLAVRLGWQLSDQWLLRTALLEGTPGDPDHPENTTVRIDDGEGTLSVAEVEAVPGQWRWLAGGWRYSASSEQLDGQGEGHNSGLYSSLEYGLDDVVGASRRQLFVRYGWADEQLNVINATLNAGFRQQLQLASQPAGQWAFGLTHAQISDSWQQQSGSDSSETTLELTWQQPFNRWLSLQPDVQRIINPGADPALADTWAFGLRVVVTPLAPQP